MTDLRTAAQQALEAMQYATPTGKITLTDWYKSITALKAALAEPVQEPVAWKDKTYETLYHQDFGNSIPLYTAPPQRKPMNEFDALRLITESIGHLKSAGPVEGLIGIIRAVERAHNIT